jgi:hypothetical protein
MIVFPSFLSASGGRKEGIKGWLKFEGSIQPIGIREILNLRHNRAVGDL